MVEYDVVTEMKRGNLECMVPKVVQPGEDVVVRVLVDDGDHHEIPQPTAVHATSPVDVWVGISKEVDDRWGDEVMPIWPRDIKIAVEKGYVVFSLKMPKCYKLTVAPYLDFPVSTLLWTNSHRDHVSIEGKLFHETKRVSLTLIGVG